MRKTIENSLTNQELIIKILEKAEKNGWKYPFKFISKDNLVTSAGKIYFAIYKIIFSHDFAKAFFGKEDEWYTTECSCGGVDLHVAGNFDAHTLECEKVKANRGYKFHLQQMVLEENPIKYLEKFI